ncbi:MAG: DUF483 domain-containing protein [Candidatus Bathyarchaeia archaeon]
MPVALDARPCALLNIPADLVGGEKLALEVESSCRDAYIAAKNEGDPRRKRELVKIFTDARREAFSRIVLNSQSFLTLTYWCTRLGLTTIRSEILPTTWEMYIFKSMLVRFQIHRLSIKRTKLRRINSYSAQTKTYPVLLAEEFSSKYVSQVGTLLGYPQCCVERFVKDRVNNISAEARASEQIRRLRDEGVELNLYVYFVKDFFPCSPSCMKAKAQGELIYRYISKLSPDAGERYKRLLAENLSLVENYSEILRMHQEKLKFLRGQL